MPPFHSIALSNDPALPTYTNYGNQLRAAESDAYEMWAKDGNMSARWFGGSTPCAAYNSLYPNAWFDLSEENSNTGYGTQAYINSGITAGCKLGGTAIGCMGPDYAGWGWSNIIAADIVMAHDYEWTVMNQDTLRECLDRGTGHANYESTFLHEVGHAYGLAHEDGKLATMNSTAWPRRNCHIQRGYSDAPWPDDVSGMEHKYSTLSGRHNLSASPWILPVTDPTTTYPYRSGAPGTTVDVVVSNTNPSRTVELKYTLEKFYDNATPQNVFVMFWLVPIGSVPSFNSTTNTWSLPAGSSTSWKYDPTILPAVEGNVQRSFFISFSVSDVSPGTYRLFAQVDATSLITETDEGDNMVPMNLVLRRN